MTRSTLFLGALAVAAAFGIATPAWAIPSDWTGPYSLHVNALDFTVGTGTLQPGLPKTHLDLTGSSIGDHSIAYAGPVSVTLNTFPIGGPKGFPLTAGVFFRD